MGSKTGSETHPLTPCLFPPVWEMGRPHASPTCLLGGVQEQRPAPWVHPVWHRAGLACPRPTDGGMCEIRLVTKAKAYSGWASVGSQVSTGSTESVLGSLSFTSYCILFHTNNCTPTSAPPCVSPSVASPHICPWSASRICPPSVGSPGPAMA